MHFNTVSDSLEILQKENRNEFQRKVFVRWTFIISPDGLMQMITKVNWNYSIFSVFSHRIYVIKINWKYFFLRHLHFLSDYLTKDKFNWLLISRKIEGFSVKNISYPNKCISILNFFTSLLSACFSFGLLEIYSSYSFFRWT